MANRDINISIDIKIDELMEFLEEYKRTNGGKANLAELSIMYVTSCEENRLTTLTKVVNYVVEYLTDGFPVGDYEMCVSGWQVKVKFFNIPNYKLRHPKATGPAHGLENMPTHDMDSEVNFEWLENEQAYIITV